MAASNLTGKKLMLHYELSREAVNDLDEIWEYSFETWGRQRANSYLNQLREGCRLLATEPTIGQDCTYIREGYRKFKVGRHVVFYRIVAADRIVIVRILHERMDVEQHLSEGE